MTDTALVTQEKLDALLAGLAAARRGKGNRVKSDKGDVELHEVSDHDFRRERLPAAPIQKLQAVSDVFAEAASHTLSGYLGAPARVSLLHVEQISYQRFLPSLSDHDVVALFALGSFQDTAALALTPSLALPIVDRLLGGEGEAPQTPRPLTAMESSLIQDVLQKLLSDFQRAWRSLAPLEIEVKQTLSSPSAAQVARPGDRVVAVSFEAGTNTLPGLLNFCLPIELVKSLGSQLPARVQELEGEQDLLSPRERLITSLHAVPLPCAISLGRVGMPLRDVASLGEGDVICLDRRPGDCLEFLVGDVPTFTCRPFVAGDKLAVEILGEIAASERR